MNSIGIRDLEKSIKLAKSIINSSESMVSMIFPLMTFFQAEDGIRDVEKSRGLGDVYKRQISTLKPLFYA